MYSKIISRFTFIIFFLVVFFTALQAQSPNLPLDHWAYPFLDRLQTKGLFIGEDFDTRPFSRQAVAEIILQIDENYQSDPALLSKVEGDLFEQLKGEFFEELKNSNRNIDIQKKEYERHLFSWDYEDLKARFDGLLGQQFKLESGEDVDIGIPKSITSWGLSGRVNIKQSMTIYGESRSFILSSVDSLANTTFNPDFGLPVTEKALVDIAVTDNTVGYAVFRLPWMDLQLGRDLVEWGPGYRGNLILSRNSNNYDLVKLSFRYKKFKYESIHAFLNSDEAKFLAGHRLEIRPSKNFQFAINETVVYGNRDVEFLYLNPFVPIIIAERHLGNQDNNMISLDGTLFIHKYNIKIYSEILFDDFSFAKNIFNNFVNKWGLMLGSYWVNPFGLNNTDLRFEVIRIQPLVYSHRSSINTYSNYNNTMGHWLGPDADNWYIEIARQFHKNLKIGITWEQRRRGVNDINQGTQPEDDLIHFLHGTVERNRILGLTGQWQIQRDLFFKVAYNFIQSKNLHRQEGLNQNNHRLFVKFFLNY